MTVIFSFARSAMTAAHTLRHGATACLIPVQRAMAPRPKRAPLCYAFVAFPFRGTFPAALAIHRGSPWHVKTVGKRKKFLATHAGSGERGVAPCSACRATSRTDSISCTGAAAAAASHGGSVDVTSGGRSGYEAASQLARTSFSATLYEMRPLWGRVLQLP